MKDNRQIVSWLRGRNWFTKFKDNLTNCKDIPQRIADDILKGNLGEHTICGAFDFKNTPEHERFWKNRNEEFLKWYEE